MPLLEVIQSRQISASVRFEEITAELVNQYAAFIHASADDVVNKALHYVFTKDRDFQDYLKTSDTQGWHRRGHPKQARTEGHSRGGVDRVSQGRKAVTGPQMPWRNEHGASHRLYLDTPPLIGNCLDTLVSR